MNKACFPIAGPDLVSMIAGEAGQGTRKVVARTFKTVIYRLVIFYLIGALCVGVLVASNDPTLVKNRGCKAQNIMVVATTLHCLYAQ